jgi:hypothetical protein
MIEWVSKKGCREKVAEVPENWLVKFAAAQPQDTRKFGDARNSTMLYRSSAVLAAVEAGMYFATDGGNPFLGPAPTGIIGMIPCIIVAICMVIHLCKTKKGTA